MVSFVFHSRCLLLFFILIQSVSLYKVYAYDDDHPDLLSSSFNEELNPSIENKNIGYEDDENIGLDIINDDSKDDVENLESKSKRSTSSFRSQPIPQRRNSRPHWNPLIAAYKRCGELVSHVERESCFKDAVQMLFVYKLKK